MKYLCFLSVVINTVNKSNLQGKGFISACKLHHWGKLGQKLRLGPRSRSHKGRLLAGLLSDVGSVEVNPVKEKGGWGVRCHRLL